MGVEQLLQNYHKKLQDLQVVFPLNVFFNQSYVIPINQGRQVMHCHLLLLSS